MNTERKIDDPVFKVEHRDFILDLFEMCGVKWHGPNPFGFVVVECPEGFDQTWGEDDSVEFNNHTGIKLV